uniref:Reverse transcriptase domain-containing protein n=1 Tax=Tanacetum cinerariifolium TaxID=118510 RepID=A0A6L2KWD0_TANCI|nr:reverse transcriptase domain-containing protein [Tanacetum cinerariifolium]
MSSAVQGTFFILELAPCFLRGLLMGIGDKKEIRDFRELVIKGMLVNIQSVQNATSIILVTALCVVDVTKWVTLPDNARVELLMRDCPRMNRATTSEGNYPNPMLAIKGNTNHGNNRNRAQGRAFGLGVVEAPQDPNVVMGMDWLSKLRVKIVCYEKIIQILLSNGDILEVHGERPEGLKQLKSMKVNELKLEDILVVCEFPSVFPEDLSGLPPSRKVKFRIDLIPGAMLVAKSPYRLAPMEMQELSNQLIELQEKERLKPRRAQAMSMKIHSSIKARILEAQSEASKGVNTLAEMLKGLDKKLKRKENGRLYLAERIWVPVYGNLRTLIINEAYTTRMKKDIAMYVSKCLTCSKVKAEHHKPSRLLQQPEIPEWKWENITINFINKLPRTSSGHDSIWVIVDRLTKSAHFLAIREDYKIERLERLYIKEIVERHGVPMSIISDRDSYFTSRFWQSLQKALGTRLDLKTTDKIVQIKERLKTAQDRQKSYADNQQKPLEYNVSDKVILKVFPWKGMVAVEICHHRFSSLLSSRNGTLNKILEKLDQMVKDFMLFKYNPRMTTRIWSGDDKRRSKEFMRMIATPGEPDLPVLVPESLQERTDEELTETDVKRMDADDQAIQTILLGLPEDVYAAVDSCETTKEIWERVRQMMKGSDIEEQEKKAKLFNE